ncbi:DUF4129 domain-containing protein [Seonamhaeicola algicola]|uniref:DUF4129 domain-containing protein n=1 Tax=Seonamhaeicola algicola TaxID=1719036 RepID=A0A5C7ANQ7_9FLAO|nr:DUF4129 domain-containing protein [Seonamhaeicola algicola]TXE09971.1 DUF4129 domain-containing protein [Seonamhaeicola algicola]
MHKKLFLHIILFLIGITAFANNNKLANDTLAVDTSTVLKPKNIANLNEIYNTDDFVYEHNVDNTGWWMRFKQWLNDFFKDLFNITSQGQASKATDIAINIAGVIIFLLVIYFIFKAIINKEGKWVFGKSSDKSIIPVTDIETNIHVTDFKALIDEAESNNNYRLAIRFYYLWLLKQLTQAEIIEYDAEKTNSDYQNEITKTNIKKEFTYTSYLYNYIWYGEFNVTATEFDQAKLAFTNFLNSLKA